MRDNNLDNLQLSFCVPTYNRDRIVEQCVKKILDLKADSIEIIVSDNGSNDNTRELITRIEDPRLKYHHNKENEGFAFNLNQTLKMASGKFCFLLSDEDEVTQSGLDKILEEIKREPNLSLIYGSIIEDNGDYNIKYNLEKYSKGNEALEAIAFNHQYMGGIVLNRTVYKNVTFKNENWYELDRFFPHEFLTFTAALSGDVQTISEPIIIRHNHNNISYSASKKIPSFHTPEGVFATFEDRVHIIDLLVKDDLQVKKRFLLRNFRLSIYTGSIFLYNITKQIEAARLHNVSCKKHNVYSLIEDFYSNAVNVLENSIPDVGNDFYKELSKIVTILKIKCVFKDLYYSQFHKLMNKALVYFRKLRKDYYA